MESIVVGALSLVGSLAGSYSGIKLMTYRIEKLEESISKHNEMIERMPVLEEKIKVINHRLEDLENGN